MSKFCIYSVLWTRLFAEVKRSNFETHPKQEQENEIALLALCLLLTFLATLLTLMMLIASFDPATASSETGPYATDTSIRIANDRVTFQEKENVSLLPEDKTCALLSHHTSANIATSLPK